MIYTSISRILSKLLTGVSRLENVTCKIVPDEVFIKLKYFAKLGRFPDLREPKRFSEKLQWLKLNAKNPFYSKLVDKYEVRKFVSSKIGEEYLIPLLGVWEDIEDYRLEKLPDQFVLKCTHDSGSIVICTNKEVFDFRQAKKKLKKRLNFNYYLYAREYPYKSVKPRIIAEEYIVDESGYELKDYKFFCFHGEPKIVQIDFDRFKNHRRQIYTSDLEPLSEVKFFNYPIDWSAKIDIPKNFPKMLHIAKILSEGIPFVCVDLYNVAGRIYFGEFTFFPEAGFFEA